MKISKLDHVNLRTNKLDKMGEWYDQVFGLKSGPRPDFPFAGAGIYVEGDAAIHLVKVDEECTSVEPKIENFAFKATGLKERVSRLDVLEIVYSVDPVPGMPITQVNLRDLDGNHIHVDFWSEPEPRLEQSKRDRQ